MLNPRDILGVKVNLTTIDSLNTLVKEIVKYDRKEIVGHHNLHSIYLFHRSDTMRKFYQNTIMNHIDGMSIVMLLKMMGQQVSRKHRITYLDWIYDLLGLSNSQKWKLFYLGSRPNVTKKVYNYFNLNYKDINIKAHHGYFPLRGHDNEFIIDQINSFNPQIVMVGMGMPRQESWILENYDKINTNVILSCGACFDYLVGEISTPPRWLGKLGFEWLYRLADEPSRLYRRYLYEPVFLIPLILEEFKKQKTEDDFFDH